jgi:catechol 2,3-dioxygenase-like lactoylglutathione lyase family enzyme
MVHRHANRHTLSGMPITRIDHVQLAIPPGTEAKARAFYTGLLGLPEREKPAILAGRGGVWFETAAFKLHLGIEQDFRPAKKAHPALQVDGLDQLLSQLTAAGCAVVDGEPVEGYRRRAFVDDPFGNRIELVEPE